MSLKSLGKVLLTVSGIVLIFLFVKLALLLRSYPMGFDLIGILKVWGIWILLWFLVTIGGFVLLTVKRISVTRF